MFSLYCNYISSFSTNRYLPDCFELSNSCSFCKQKRIHILSEENNMLQHFLRNLTRIHSSQDDELIKTGWTMNH